MVSGKMPFFFPLVVFFSIISYKNNPAGVISSCFDVFLFLVPLSYVSSLGGKGVSQAQWGRKVSPSSFLSVEPLTDLTSWAHLEL